MGKGTCVFGCISSRAPISVSIFYAPTFPGTLDFLSYVPSKMNKEALISIAGYLYVIFWVRGRCTVLGDMWDKASESKEPSKCKKEQRQRAMQTPMEGFVIPAERQEVDPGAQAPFT